MYVLHLLFPLHLADPRKGPILLACQSQDDVAIDAWKELPIHRDEAQVQLDVDRSFVYYPEGIPSIDRPRVGSGADNP